MYVFLRDTSVTEQGHHPYNIHTSSTDHAHNGYDTRYRAAAHVCQFCPLCRRADPPTRCMDMDRHVDIDADMDRHVDVAADMEGHVYTCPSTLARPTPLASAPLEAKLGAHRG